MDDIKACLASGGQYLGWTERQWQTAADWYTGKFGTEADRRTIRAAWQQYRGIVQP